MFNQSNPSTPAVSDSPNPLFKAHLRIARPTPSIPSVLPFYIQGLGFTLLSSFNNHNGFDGAILGHPSLPYHLEFTTQHGHEHEGRAPTKDNLLVFYLPDQEEWTLAVERMQSLGFESVRAENPWWEGDGKEAADGGTEGRTYEDADGWKVVLYRGVWN
ncbi:Glyoxalase/Bleomycin resistance protein/Dihydroxybiphenyl dioxygenase, partial [Polyplosphaeria fusca]